MPVYELVDGGFVPASQTLFQSEGIKERQDIQRMLRDQITILGDNLFVLAEEYGAWVDSNRRIDLLCIDGDANLVVIELKRDDSGHMELQALRYAAMVARMTFANALDAHVNFRRRIGLDEEGAEAAILDFLGWSQPSEENFAKSVRIILASADFSKELTTAVLWLSEQGIKITCVRMTLCKLSDGRLLLDVEQIIPLPEAADFQTQIGIKRQAERKDLEDRHELRREFWSGLISQPMANIYKGKAAPIGGWLGGKTVRRGINLNLAIRRDGCQAEFYIDRGRDSNLENKAIFDHLMAHRAEIEERFGSKLLWQRLDEARACRIAAPCAGGWLSPKSEWDAIQRALLDASERLYAAASPFLDSQN